MTSEQGAAPHPPGKRRVAVIGAGVSGLATAKCLLDEGLEPVVYEQESQIGGLWNYDETLPDGGGIMYRSLRTNTSKHTLAFSDFPLPETLPDFPHHSEILQYLRAYAASFGLQQYIQFNTVVESARPTGQQQWSVRTSTGQQSVTETFDAVIICSGRDRYPTLPQLPGRETFVGKILHSHSYKGPEEFAGQDVIVCRCGKQWRRYCRRIERGGTPGVPQHNEWRMVYSTLCPQTTIRSPADTPGSMPPLSPPHVLLLPPATARV